MASPHSDADLLRYVVAHAGDGRLRGPRWGHVVARLPIGSTSAAALCVRFGLDPDEIVGQPDDRAWFDCDRDDDTDEEPADEPHIETPAPKRVPARIIHKSVRPPITFDDDPEAP